MKGLRSNLFGLPAIRTLSLATRLDETVAESTPPLSATYIHDRFRKNFQGLGNLGEEYEVKLKPGTTRFALFTPRRVALPLRESRRGTETHGDNDSLSRLPSADHFHHAVRVLLFQQAAVWDLKCTRTKSTKVQTLAQFD